MTWMNSFGIQAGCTPRNRITLVILSGSDRFSIIVFVTNHWASVVIERKLHPKLSHPSRAFHISCQFILYLVNCEISNVRCTLLFNPFDSSIFPVKNYSENDGRVGRLVAPPTQTRAFFICQKQWGWGWTFDISSIKIWKTGQFYGSAGGATCGNPGKLPIKAPSTFEI